MVFDIGFWALGFSMHLLLRRPLSPSHTSAQLPPVAIAISLTLAPVGFRVLGLMGNREEQRRQRAEKVEGDGEGVEHGVMVKLGPSLVALFIC